MFLGLDIFKSTREVPVFLSVIVYKRQSPGQCPRDTEPAVLIGSAVGIAEDKLPLSVGYSKIV